jgi:hypothetical protein
MHSWLVPLVMGTLAAAAVLFIFAFTPPPKRRQNAPTSPSSYLQPDDPNLHAPPQTVPSANKPFWLASVVGLIGLALVLIAVLAYE